MTKDADRLKLLIDNVNLLHYFLLKYVDSVKRTFGRGTGIIYGTHATKFLKCCQDEVTQKIFSVISTILTVVLYFHKIWMSWTIGIDNELNFHKISVNYASWPRGLALNGLEHVSQSPQNETKWTSIGKMLLQVNVVRTHTHFKETIFSDWNSIQHQTLTQSTSV